jgi:hypothetical protein
MKDILASFSAAEIFYTFAIESLLAFLRKNNPVLLQAQLAALGIAAEDLRPLEGLMNNQAWLGAAERLVFSTFQADAPYVSPFSIHNPDGWRYWLIHFAKSYRARQEYNNVLHQNSNMQAHFGRSGLDMLSYSPLNDTGSLYLFDVSGRQCAKDELTEDIPRLVTGFGDAVRMQEFYEAIYNKTPAHMDDIHAAMIDNADLQVITEAGGERRKPHAIGPSDVLRMKKQRSFFPMFFSAPQSL